jgi:hypothetical protein
MGHNPYPLSLGQQDGDSARHNSGSPPKPIGHALRLGIWVLILPCLYVLSLGPIWRFGLLSENVFRAFYGPLIVFEERCGPLDRFILVHGRCLAVRTMVNRSKVSLRSNNE